MLWLRAASKPACPTAMLYWQHGTVRPSSPSFFSLLFSPTNAPLPARAQYSINSNGSLSMNPLPFATDGRIQTENPCTPQTAVLAEYAEFEMWDTWEIKIDSHHEAYSLQAVRADIGKLPRCVSRSPCSSRGLCRGRGLTRLVSCARRLFLTVRPPTMLPTTSLTAVLCVGALSLRCLCAAPP